MMVSFLLITFFTAGEVREIKLRRFLFTAHKLENGDKKALCEQVA